MVLTQLDHVTIAPTGEPLPMWAAAYLHLGISVASYPSTSNSLVVAAALPTRAYAAAFVAAGVVLECASQETAPDVDTHVDQLLKLRDERGPIPVCIIYGPQKKTSGLFVGLEDRPQGLYLRVEIPKGLPKLLPFEQGLRVQPVEQLKYAGRVKPLAATGQAFLTGVLDAINPVQYLTTSRLDCLVVGVETRICEEIREAKLCFGPHAGCLQDVLRVRSCPPLVDSYRSEVVSDRNPAPVLDGKPHVVVFDGAPGFLKWRRNWRGCPWVVLLDRTEVQFDDAVAQVNNSYLQRVGDPPDLDIAHLPSAVEVTAFEMRG